MRFMMMVQGQESSGPPSPELIAAVGRYGARMAEAGVLIEAGGLLPTAMGARIDVSSEGVIVTDGPFAETKEQIGGYAIIRADSKAAAIEHGKEFMKLHTDVIGPSYTGRLEIRAMAD
jgi:hypothetical protein